MLNDQEIEDIMTKLKRGGQVDLCLSNGIVRSSKDCIGNLSEDGTFDHISVWHSISDAWSLFTEDAFRSVLKGERSIWDGDIENDNDEIEWDENGDIVDEDNDDDE